MHLMPMVELSRDDSEISRTQQVVDMLFQALFKHPTGIVKGC